MRQKKAVDGRGGRRAGSGRPPGSGGTDRDARIGVPVDLLVSLARLAGFSGMSVSRLVTVVLSEWAADRLAMIGEDALQRFELFESAKLLKGQSPHRRRLTFAQASEISGASPDVFRAGWDEALALADEMTADQIEVEIISLRAEASRRFRDRLAAHGDRLAADGAEIAGRAPR